MPPYIPMERVGVCLGMRCIHLKITEILPLGVFDVPRRVARMSGCQLAA